MTTDSEWEMIGAVAGRVLESRDPVPEDGSPDGFPPEVRRRTAQAFWDAALALEGHDRPFRTEKQSAVQNRHSFTCPRNVPPLKTRGAAAFNCLDHIVFGHATYNALLSALGATGTDWNHM